jgi:uncharacterized membrane protein YccC
MPKLARQAVISSLNSFAAAMLALYIAFALDLQRPYWAMMTVYITSNPFSGAVRSKAVYRMAGTLIGAAAMIVLVPNLDAEPLLLSFALALWVAGCLVVSLLDRTPRSYMLLLSGYTAALIGFPAVNQPDAVFDIAVSRMEEIGVGIVCAAVMHSLVFPRPVGQVLQARLGAWLETADRWLLDLAEGREAPEDLRRRQELAAATSDIRIQATHLPFDTSRLRETQAAVRALHERMLLLIPALSSVADRRRALAETRRRLPRAAQARLEEVAAWIRAGASYEPSHELVASIRNTAATYAAGDWHELLLESLLTELADAAVAIAQCHAVLARVRAPDAPLPRDLARTVATAARRPLSNDLRLALRSGLVCVLGVMSACVIWIDTGWPDGATAASLVAVFCTLFATLDDPAPAIIAFSAASIVTLTLGALYVFGVFQAIDGFPLLAAVLFPPLFLFGVLIGDPKTTQKGLPLAITFASALGLQETVKADFAAFLNGNLAVYVGSFVAVFLTRALRSMTAEASAHRLLRLTWTAIARLAGGHLSEPRNFAAVLVDRLALLTPRLALQTATGVGVGEGALRDLRLALDLSALKRTQPGLEVAEQARIGNLMDGLAGHYGRLARGGESAPPDGLLPTLDEVLSKFAGRADPVRRRAALSLVGVRRDLFPAAAPFVAAEEQSA